jgi:integrase
MSVLDDFLTEYHAYNAITPDRRWKQRNQLLKFEDYVGGDLLAGDAPALRAYLASQLDAGLKPTSVRCYLGQIRPFYTWAFERGLIDAERRLGFIDLKPPRGGRDHVPRPYSRKELALFWDELDEAWPLLTGKDLRYIGRWRRGTSPWKRVQSHANRLQIEAIVSLELYGGLRPDEVYRLELEDIHPDNDAVVARSRKNREGVWVARSVPMFEPMRDALTAWVEFRSWIDPDHDRPWLTLWHQYRAKPATTYMWERWIRRIGRGWLPYRFRHTCATELLRARMPLEKVQKILGHANPQQTLAYAQLLDSDVLEAGREVEKRYLQNIGRTRRAA